MQGVRAVIVCCLRRKVRDSGLEGWDGGVRSLFGLKRRQNDQCGLD